MAISIPTLPESREIISRKEALKRGFVRYFTGKPCKQGHIAERHTVRKECIECARLKSRKQYWADPQKENARRLATRQANPEKARAYDRAYSAKWKKANPEKVNARNRAWREKNPELAKEFRLRWEAKHKQRLQNDPVYAAEFNAKNTAKGQKQRYKNATRPRPAHCEICGDTPEEICFDHCHQSGKFRGWLCHRCNRVLGLTGDSPELHERLAQYLEKHTLKGV